MLHFTMKGLMVIHSPTTWPPTWLQSIFKWHIVTSLLFMTMWSWERNDDENSITRKFYLEHKELANFRILTTFILKKKLIFRFSYFKSIHEQKIWSMYHRSEGNKFKFHQSSNKQLNLSIYPCTILPVCMCSQVHVFLKKYIKRKQIKLFYKLLDVLQ